MTSHFSWVNVRVLACRDSGRGDDTRGKSRLGSPSVGQANHLLSPDKTFGQAAARLCYCNACGGFGWSLPAGPQWRKWSSLVSWSKATARRAYLSPQCPVRHGRDCGTLRAAPKIRIRQSDYLIHGAESPNGLLRFKIGLRTLLDLS